VVGLLVWSVAAGVLAQGASESSDAEARALFNAGQVAFEDARFDDALGYFKRAHELSGRPGLLFNIASAAERVRKDAVALGAYQSYLEALPDAPNRRFVEGRIRFLKQAMSAAESEAPEAEPDAPRVPTPEEAARTAPADEPVASPHHDLHDEGEGKGSVLGKWWFWTVIGAVVVAGAVTGVVLATRGGGSTQEPLPGDIGPGGVVITLGGGGP
jgi:tetratricopeptide (TPR) repeat protein